MFDRIARRLRPHELGHDGRAAPPLARARRRPRAASARATACSTSPPAPATSRSSCARASRPAARSSAATSPRRCSRWRARRRRELALRVGQRAGAALRRRRVRRRDGRLRRAQLLRPRPRPGRDGARRAARRPRRGARDHDAAARRRCRWFFRLWFDRVVPLLGQLAGDPDAYDYLPNSVKRFPAPARAGGGAASAPA